MDYVFKLIGLEDICIFGSNYLSLRHRQNFPNELYMAIFIISYIIYVFQYFFSKYNLQEYDSPSFSQ